MENTAWLAILEQRTIDSSRYKVLLQVLEKEFKYFLDHPSKTGFTLDVKKFTAVSSDNLSGFHEYLTYLGFEDLNNGYFVYKPELARNALQMAYVAIKRKLFFLEDQTPHSPINVGASTSSKKDYLKPIKVLKTNNNFLMSLQHMFNDILRYEDHEAQELARAAVPFVTLQVRAINRIREHQMQIKEGIPVKELPLEMALLYELVHWFKETFFKWIDEPKCMDCKKKTVFQYNTKMVMGNEECRVEVYRCRECRLETSFPRYNDPRTLLKTRTGRCGEWANCFTLILRALGFDARYVYDTTDHVWCEVFDAESNCWVHVDPCEATVNSPLIYENGWGKKLEYVIAFSRDDIQDVTWRYSSEHKAVMSRRNKCTEEQLTGAILRLRAERQDQVTAARRKYLAKRTLQELAMLMVERVPADYESGGRVSGSREWRRERGELGLDPLVPHAPHTFNVPFEASVIQYTPRTDTYVHCANGRTVGSELRGWRHGTYVADNVRLVLEEDTSKTYIARKDGSKPGTVLWRFKTPNDLKITNVVVNHRDAYCRSGGTVVWSARYEGGDWKEFSLLPAMPTTDVNFDEALIDVQEFEVRAVLSGGSGPDAWRHSRILCNGPGDDRPSLTFKFYTSPKI